jgi:DNA-binding NtrC family response regulator
MERPSLSLFPLLDENYLGRKEWTMSKRILLVGSKPDSGWIGTLQQSLDQWGELQVAAETDGLSRLRGQAYDLIILDAAVIDDLNLLVQSIRQERPNVPVVVVTNSPTWQRARQLFTDGASDYVRKSFDTGALKATFSRILSKSPAG